MTFRNLLELLQVCALGVVAAAFFRFTRREGLRGERGILPIRLGFLLLFLGSVADLSDGFPALAVLYVFGPTPLEAFLETVIGYILGPVLVAFGFLRWLPALAIRQREAGEAIGRSQVAQERHERFFSLALDLLCVADFAGRFRLLNPAFERTLGYPMVELLDRPFLDLVHPDDRERTITELARLSDGRDTLAFVNRYVCKDGSIRWLAWTAHPEPETGIIYAAAHDVTELKDAERELSRAHQEAQAANRAKSIFLARMSHELRTPLNAVIGFANVLAKNREGRLDERDLSYVQRIRDNGAHLLALINDVLDLSRVEADRLELHPERVDLRAFVETILAELGPIALAAGLELEAELPDGPLEVEADPVRLKQIVVNLVGNAIKFTDRGAVRLRIRLGELSRSPASLEVADSGPGIAPEALPKLFDEFYQGSAEPAKREQGAGLGLSIAKALAEKMGFGLDVESTLGRGSVFRLRLTREKTSEFSSREIDARDVAAALVPEMRLDGLRLVVVDDDDDTRLLMIELVSELGGEVAVASTCEEAMALIRNLRPDLVTLDLILRSEDGRKLLSDLAAEPELAALPVVILSIVGTERRLELPPTVGVVDKPIDRARLLDAFRRALRGGAPA